MNLLAAKLYDPATAVSKSTAALLALTAIDTTNLRLAFKVPPSGMVRVRMSAVVHGATTFPTILLGVLEGATVKGRVAPVQSLGNTAVATAQVFVEADFIVSGLTPDASLSWDAAYGVETIVASTGLKYGGPNNTTANDAFGGFCFEIWDPCPAYTPTSGVPPTSPVHVKLDTIDDFLDTEIAAIKAKTDNLPSDPADASDIATSFTGVNTKLDTIDEFLDTEVAAIKAKTDQLAFTKANEIDANIQSVNGVTVAGDGESGTE